MSGLYTVITVGHGDRIRRASRAGEGFAKVDVSNENWTYRIELTEGEPEPVIMRIRKRWRHADASPEPEWDLGVVNWNLAEGALPDEVASPHE